MRGGEGDEVHGKYGSDDHSIAVLVLRIVVLDFRGKQLYRLKAQFVSYFDLRGEVKGYHM